MSLARPLRPLALLTLVAGLLLIDGRGRPHPALEAQAPPAGIAYIYDALGRLRAVVDPASDTAMYAYDAAGNILSITRQSSALVSLIEVVPNSAPVGATVTISGTGFSTTAGQNTVTFNGTAATVTAATATQIVTTVPAGATSGAIVVTTRRDRPRAGRRLPWRRRARRQSPDFRRASAPRAPRSP